MVQLNPEKKKVNIPMPEGQKTVTIDAHPTLEKTIANVSSHNSNFNAKSIEEETAHHQSLNNNYEHAIKTIQTSVKFSTNGCGRNSDMNSIIEGIEAVTSRIVVNQSNDSAHSQSNVQNDIEHFAEYIAENKIKEMPKNFHTKVVRLNMATQLYKFDCKKTYLNLFDE
ncbi:Uncharacterized protein Fot_19117 [Forsythia ovata]|uniref:Late embryogenesis abundant protein n=1 Tax=Forsythia ovata TaxID=205694 RepID=A0ABD1VKI0_9LAMI